jgi:hypothetical protein
MKTCIRFPRNPIPKLCWGCGEPFPLRDGRIEAQLGQDGRLYCYAKTPECAVLAVKPAPLDRAA